MRASGSADAPDGSPPLAGTGLFTFYEALILQTSIDVFTSAALLCFTFALTRDNLRWMIATGAIFGLQALDAYQHRTSPPPDW